VRAAYAAHLMEQESALLRTALRLCRGNEEEAQEMVQEAVVRGYDAYWRGQFQEGSNMRAWLLRILTNVFLTHYRRRQRDIGMETALLNGENRHVPESLLAAPQDRPEAVLLTETLDEPLERALAALPDDLRLCVVLVDIEEWTYRDAAAIVGIPVGTLRSRLWRARLLLQARLFDYARSRRRV
jgi:RNA polymerase sigma-70 factor (ECF subfamily)